MLGEAGGNRRDEEGGNVGGRGDGGGSLGEKGHRRNGG